MILYHPQNLHGKIRSGSTAGEDYRIHIFDRKSYPDRNIRDWTDDPAGFLPVQGTKKMQLGDVEKEKMPENGSVCGLQLAWSLWYLES